MIQMIRRLNVPATESQLAIALVVSAITMGLMLWAIIWQANIIGFQRQLIQSMWSAQFGG